VSTRPIDLLVAGGGAAGLVTALHAAHAGIHVEVWEPRAGDVDKACGEGLMPGALASLQSLGVDPPGHAFRGIRYVGHDDFAG
jgi:flavin-dependent dehydrogenase